MSKPASKYKVDLPVRPFLYTIDQIATLLAVTEQNVKAKYLHYDGRSTGVCPRDRMVARNIAPDGERPDWRVAEKEFRRWLKHKHFRIYDAALVTS